MSNETSETSETQTHQVSPFGHENLYETTETTPLKGWFRGFGFRATQRDDRTFLVEPCQDPIERMSEAKVHDGQRLATVDLCEVWWARHGGRPISAKDVDPAVLEVLDRHGRGRQYVVSQLEKFDGARVGGFVFTRQAAVGKWGIATYAIRKIDDETKS